MNTVKKKVAIYCRVSTLEQAEEGYSIKEQERLLREYCYNNHYEIFKVYSDAGISGKDIKSRPAMQQALHDGTNKEYDMLISWKINRISRKLSDAIKIVETLENYGITYQSYSEAFDSETPSGKMQFQMMALVGEFERSTISQNVKMGMLAKAKAGEWCGGSPPLGYKWELMNNTNRKKSKLVIDEKEAHIVREMYELYAKGKGYKAITNEFNKKGYRTKKGRMFAVGQVSTVLTNPVYIGKVRYDVRRNWNEKRRNNINPNPVIVDGIHEAIIGEVLWNKVQILMSEKGGKPSRLYSGEYPLTGILKCPVCGAGMVISRTTNKRKDGTVRRVAYYACGAWKNQGTAVCRSNTVNVEKANEVVFHELGKILNNSNLLKSIVKKINKDNAVQLKTNEKELKRLEEEKDLLKVKNDRLLDTYLEGVHTKEEYMEYKENLKNELDNIYIAIQSLQVINDEILCKNIPYETIQNILQDFSKMINNEGIERTLKKHLLHMLIDEITVDQSRNIDTIKINLTDELAMFLNDRDETLCKGVSSLFMYKTLGLNRMSVSFTLNPC